MNENRKTIILANGKVAYPAEWILVDNPYGTNEEATNVVVVEARNFITYNIPRFILPVSIEKLTAEDAETIIDACCDAYPDLIDIVAMQIDPPSTDYHKDPNYFIEMQAHLDSTYLGVFRVRATDDPDFDPNHEYPYGVVVVRNCKEVNKYDGAG